MKYGMRREAKGNGMPWIHRQMLRIREWEIVRFARKKNGMEMVQVAILVALAVALGIIFKTQITAFVNDVFAKLDSSQF
jgi:hypothetical protein